MSTNYMAYLDLLTALTKELQTLSQLATDKSAAVHSDDLLALDNIMRREQAISLTFRGLEQKKDSLSRALGLDGVSLSAQAGHYPAELQLQAKKTIEALQDQYRIYCAAAEVARNTLECNLHEIEKFLAAQDASAAAAGPGYTQSSAAELPQSMKSDFRA